MTTPTPQRGAKRHTFTPAHLADVPSPLSAGRGLDWAPVKAQQILLSRGEAAALGDPSKAAETSQAAWIAYRKALAAADAAHYGDDRPDRFRKDWLAGTYNRARLGAWTAALGKDGRDHWAAHIGQEALERALQKLTGGEISADLIPDLPGRCDLTDAAQDVASRLEEGRESWRTMRVDLAGAAEDCAREALEEMGWEGGDE
jgi:hypothetical protein